MLNVDITLTVLLNVKLIEIEVLIIQIKFYGKKKTIT